MNLTWIVLCPFFRPGTRHEEGICHRCPVGSERSSQGLVQVRFPSLYLCRCTRMSWTCVRSVMVQERCGAHRVGSQGRGVCLGLWGAISSQQRPAAKAPCQGHGCPFLTASHRVEGDTSVRPRPALSAALTRSY